MKHIKRHYSIYSLKKGTTIRVTIVGELSKKNPDGSYTFTFGAARASIKDNFVKSKGMALATERFKENPCTERITSITGRFSDIIVEYGIVRLIAENPEYIRIHFKTK